MIPKIERRTTPKRLRLTTVIEKPRRTRWRDNQPTSGSRATAIRTATNSMMITGHNFSVITTSRTNAAIFKSVANGIRSSISLLSAIRAAQCTTLAAGRSRDVDRFVHGVTHQRIMLIEKRSSHEASGSYSHCRVRDTPRSRAATTEEREAADGPVRRRAAAHHELHARFPRRPLRLLPRRRRQDRMGLRQRREEKQAPRTRNDRNDDRGKPEILRRPPLRDVHDLPSREHPSGLAALAAAGSATFPDPCPAETGVDDDRGRHRSICKSAREARPEQVVIARPDRHA